MALLPGISDNHPGQIGHLNPAAITWTATRMPSSG